MSKFMRAQGTISTIDLASENSHLLSEYYFAKSRVAASD